MAIQSRSRSYLGQLLVQFAALLSCHYCNSVLTFCLCLTLANKMMMTMMMIYFVVSGKATRE